MSKTNRHPLDDGTNLADLRKSFKIQQQMKKETKIDVLEQEELTPELNPFQQKVTDVFHDLVDLYKKHGLITEKGMSPHMIMVHHQAGTFFLQDLTYFLNETLNKDAAI